jgi:hypothetical protein
MTEAKVEIRVGEIAFSGQGEQEWVARQTKQDPRTG